MFGDFLVVCFVLFGLLCDYFSARFYNYIFSSMQVIYFVRCLLLFFFDIT